MDTNDIFAGKIVPKSMLTKPHQKDKVCKLNEIQIYMVTSQLLIDGHGD